MREPSRLTLGSLMAALLLFLATLLLFCYHLGKNGFKDDAPARVSVMAEQMNLQGKWLSVALHGQEQWSEPPLHLWLVKIAGGLGPGISAFETRLPGAICGILLVMLAGWWFQVHAQRYARDDGAEAPPEGFGLLAGLMLATSPILMFVARSGLSDATFALFYLAAAYCFSESLEARRSFYAGHTWQFWVCWGYAAAGLAMLTRGPLVLIAILLPYLLATHSYRLRRPGAIHAAGLALALAISGWWVPAVAGRVPGGILGAFKIWIMWGFDPHLSHVAWAHYPFDFLLETLPWILPALVMLVRVTLKMGRSPTLVFWAFALEANFLLFWFQPGSSEHRLITCVPFVALLATDGIYRWNFENAWAAAWRTFQRVTLGLALALCIFIAVLMVARLGLTLFILVAIGWFAWMIYTRGYQFTPWESALRLASITVLIFIAAESMYLSDWVPREVYHSDMLGYFERVGERLAHRDHVQLYYYDTAPAPLYDYHLPALPELSTDLAAMRRKANDQTFLFARRDLDKLSENPALVPMVTLTGRAGEVPRDMMFKVLPAAVQATTPTAAARFDRLTTQALAVLGDTGTRSSKQRDVGNRLSKFVMGRDIQHALLLGDNLMGPSEINHLDFIRGFERPYTSVLKHGVLFHALLGHEDQSHALLQLYYSPFHMEGRRYYKLPLGGGLVDCFMLDSDRAAPGAGIDAKQLGWLKDGLAASHAPWKILALHRALYSAAANAKPDEALAKQLEPLIKSHGVSFVLWAGGPWYERLALPGDTAVYVGDGWSGEPQPARFDRADPRLKAADDRHGGFVLLEFTAHRAVLTAIDSNGSTADRVELTAPAL